MKVYQIVGLTKTFVTGISYETDSSHSILQDETGHGIRKHRIYTDYRIYIVCEHTYYAIRLSKHDCPSCSGKLCYIGMMRISRVKDREVHSALTHLPIRPLSVYANLECKEYDWDAAMKVVLHDEPDTYVFQFSSIGGNPRDPCGYVYVNMELFQDVSMIAAI